MIIFSVSPDIWSGNSGDSDIVSNIIYMGFFLNTCPSGHMTSLTSYEYFLYLQPESCAPGGKRSQLVMVPSFASKNKLAHTGEKVKKLNQIALYLLRGIILS